MPVTRIFLALLALCIAALSFSFGRTGLASLRHIQLPYFVQLQSLRQSEKTIPSPRSIRYRSALVIPCIEDQQSPEAQFFPQADRLALARTCSQIAAETLTQSPTDSLARLALANAIFVQNDMVQVNEALNLAQKTAPNEGWLAAYRVELAFSLGPALTPPYALALDRDISLLLSGYRNQPYLARIYLDWPDQKKRILFLVEQHPPDIQRAFLAAVQAAI
ncbi:hypothetical protein [Falsihalocynthiibacter arcticus]|uniref:hypothetical protein n=1 Tax=Falsihalocynthiibacter arcticus TaxID=1579316 RepID=UPI0012E921B2|nr:hypothetical protein [Falsihalocynthiibacter arcticus]